MWFNSVFNVAHAGRGHALLGTLGNRGGAIAIPDVLTAGGMAAREYQATDAFVDFPDLVIAKNSAEAVIAVGGATASLINEFYDSAVGYDTTRNLGLVRFIDRKAELLAGRLFEYFGGLPPKISFHGYSMGGAICAATMEKLITGRTYASQYLHGIAVGCPRFCTGTTALHMAGCQFLRYFRPDDPVPFLPPHGDEEPALHALIGIAGRRRFNELVACGGGLQLNMDGGATLRTNPEGFNHHGVFRAASYFRTLMLSGNAEHSWQGYAQALARCSAIDLTPSEAQG